MFQRVVRGVSSAVSSTVTSRVAKGAGRYEARALNLPSTNSPLAQKRFLGPVSALSSGSSQREAQQTGIKSGHVSKAVQDFGKLAKTPAAPLLERHPKSISPLVKDISTTFNGSLDQDLSHHNTIHQAGNVHWWRNALLATVMSNNYTIRDAFTPSSEINALLSELVSGANQGMSSSDPVEAGHAPILPLSTKAEENEEDDAHPTAQAGKVARTPEPPSLNGAVNGPDETSTSNIAHHNPNENRDGGYIDVNRASVEATESDELPQGNNDGTGRADAAQRDYLTVEPGPRRAGVSLQGASSNDASPAASASTPHEQVHELDNPMHRLPEQLGGAPDEASQENDPSVNRHRGSIDGGHAPGSILRAGADNVTRTPVSQRQNDAVNGPNDGNGSGNSGYVDVGVGVDGANGNSAGVPRVIGSDEDQGMSPSNDPEALMLDAYMSVAAADDDANRAPTQGPGSRNEADGAGSTEIGDLPSHPSLGMVRGQGHIYFDTCPEGQNTPEEESSQGSDRGQHGPRPPTYGEDDDSDDGNYAVAPPPADGGLLSAVYNPLYDELMYGQPSSVTGSTYEEITEEVFIRGYLEEPEASQLWAEADWVSLNPEQKNALDSKDGLALYMPENMTYRLKREGRAFHAQCHNVIKIEPKFISTIVNMIDNLLLQSTETPHEVSINSTDDNFKTIALAYLKILQDEKGIEINCTLDEKLVDFKVVQVSHLDFCKTRILNQSQIKEDLDEKARSAPSATPH